MARDKKTRIRYVRSSHWTTIKWETGSWFIECQGFLVCLKQQTLEWSQNLFITLPIELGTVIPNRIQPFHGGSIYLLWKDCFPGGTQVCIMEFCSFISPKLSLRSLRSWVEDSSPPTFPLLPVSKIMLKNRAEKLAEGTRGGGWGMEGMSETKWIMNLKIANYLVSYSSEPWHNDQPQSRFFSLNGFTFKQAN